MGRTKGSKNKSKLSQEDVIEIIRLYKEERIALYKLGKMFHSHNNTIKDILLENKVELRDFRDAKRLYPLNENYFEQIDSKDKAY